MQLFSSLVRVLVAAAAAAVVSVDALPTFQGQYTGRPQYRGGRQRPSNSQNNVVGDGGSGLRVHEGLFIKDITRDLSQPLSQTAILTSIAFAMSNIALANGDAPTRYQHDWQPQLVGAPNFRYARDQKMMCSNSFLQQALYRLADQVLTLTLVTAFKFDVYENHNYLGTGIIEDNAAPRFLPGLLSQQQQRQQQQPSNETLANVFANLDFADRPVDTNPHAWSNAGSSQNLSAFYSPSGPVKGHQGAFNPSASPNFS